MIIVYMFVEFISFYILNLKSYSSCSKTEKIVKTLDDLANYNTLSNVFLIKDIYFCKSQNYY